jgi:hypothetical protein
MKTIRLTQGLFTTVDDNDFINLSKFKWHAHKGCNTWYAVRNQPRCNGKRPDMKMHRIIISAPDGIGVDHIDGNGLNNQKHNLRLCTHRENGQNQHVSKTSKYPGVSWHKASHKWRSTISTPHGYKHLGVFTTEEEAFKAYVCEIAISGLS